MMFLWSGEVVIHLDDGDDFLTLLKLSKYTLSVWTYLCVLTNQTCKRESVYSPLLQHFTSTLSWVSSQHLLGESWRAAAVPCVWLPESSLVHPTQMGLFSLPGKIAKEQRSGSAPLSADALLQLRTLTSVATLDTGLEYFPTHRRTLSDT